MGLELETVRVLFYIREEIGSEYRILSFLYLFLTLFNFHVSYCDPFRVKRSNTMKKFIFMICGIVAFSGCDEEFDSSFLEEPDPNSLMFMMASGFDHPIAWENYMSNGNYGACGSGGGYFPNKCHIGHDIIYPRGTNIYSLAAGTVIRVSASQDTSKNCPSGWGYDYGYTNTCNMAVALQHYDDDGNPFVAVYGHLVYDPSYGVGTTFSPGQLIAPIARYYNVNGTYVSADHLHFGVYPGTSEPTEMGYLVLPRSSTGSQSHDSMAMQRLRF